MKSLILTAALSALALATGTQLLGAQSIQTRPAAEVRLSPDPVLSVGMLDGPDEYLFGDINAGALLDDGSVVLSDQMNFRIQRFGQDGEHLWSRGREGEGPGEFQRVQIVNGCASANRIVVYDIWTQRVSVFDDEGDLVNDYGFLYNGLPIRRFACAPNGHLVFTGDSDRTVEGLASEELYRELMTLGWVELGDTAATTLRERIPGAEMRYLGPGAAMPGSIWEHNVAIAAANEGIWFGSSEDYEVELIGWTGLRAPLGMGKRERPRCLSCLRQVHDGRRRRAVGARLRSSRRAKRVVRLRIGWHLDPYARAASPHAPPGHRR